MAHFQSGYNESGVYVHEDRSGMIKRNSNLGCEGMGILTMEENSVKGPRTDGNIMKAEVLTPGDLIMESSFIYKDKESGGGGILTFIKSHCQCVTL